MTGGTAVDVFCAMVGTDVVATAAQAANAVRVRKLRHQSLLQWKWPEV
jgi:hypothetical protein